MLFSLFSLSSPPDLCSAAVALPLRPAASYLLQRRKKGESDSWSSKHTHKLKLTHNRLLLLLSLLIMQNPSACLSPPSLTGNPPLTSHCILYSGPVVAAPFCPLPHPPVRPVRPPLSPPRTRRLTSDSHSCLRRAPVLMSFLFAAAPGSVLGLDHISPSARYEPNSAVSCNDFSFCNQHKS